MNLDNNDDKVSNELNYLILTLLTEYRLKNFQLRILQKVKKIMQPNNKESKKNKRNNKKMKQIELQKNKQKNRNVMRKQLQPGD